MQTKLNHINAINTIICIAEAEILERTGLKMRLLVVSDLPERINSSSPAGMLSVIANALKMTNDDYFNKSRLQDYVHLRQIGCYLIKQYYNKRLTLKEIGGLLDGIDHTTVIHNVKTVERLLQAEDKIITEKYQAALEAVTQWLAE